MKKFFKKIIQNYKDFINSLNNPIALYAAGGAFEIIMIFWFLFLIARH